MTEDHRLQQLAHWRHEARCALGPAAEREEIIEMMAAWLVSAHFTCEIWERRARELGYTEPPPRYVIEAPRYAPTEEATDATHA